MPIVPFESLPDSARIWVFGSDRPLPPQAATRLLAEVDRFLAGWAAHGAPLHAGRDWREDHFLTIAVDPRYENASGCSIDVLYRGLRALEPAIGASLLGGGRIHYRTPGGDVAAATRDDIEELAASGALARDTRVFDTTLTSLGDWRRRFETTVGESWYAQLVG
jgi:hypothetical protein